MSNKEAEQLNYQGSITEEVAGIPILPETARLELGVQDMQRDAILAENTLGTNSGESVDNPNGLAAIITRSNGKGFDPSSKPSSEVHKTEVKTTHAKLRPRTAIAVGLIAGLGAGLVSAGATADKAEAAVDFVNENQNPGLWSSFLEANADGKGPQRVIVVDRMDAIEGISSPETQIARRIGVLHYDKDFVEQKKREGKPYNGDFYERVVVRGELTEGQYMARAVASVLSDGNPENMVIIDELRADSKDQLRDFVTTMNQLMIENPNIRPEQIAISIGTGKNKSWSKSKDIIRAALKAGFQVHPQVYVEADDWVYAHTYDNDARDEVVAGQFLGDGHAGNDLDRMIWLLDEAEKLDSKSLISPIIGITGKYANTKIPSQFVDRLMYIYYKEVIPNAGSKKQQAMLRKMGLGTWKADGRTTLSKVKHAVASNDAYAAGRQTPRISRNVILNNEQSAIIKKARAKIERKEIERLNRTTKNRAGDMRARSVINQHLKAQR